MVIAVKHFCGRYGAINKYLRTPSFQAPLLSQVYRRGRSFAKLNDLLKVTCISRAEIKSSLLPLEP